jgi:hypothetical protein
MSARYVDSVILFGGATAWNVYHSCAPCGVNRRPDVRMRLDFWSPEARFLTPISWTNLSNQVSEFVPIFCISLQAGTPDRTLDHRGPEHQIVLELTNESPCTESRHQERSLKKICRIWVPMSLYSHARPGRCYVSKHKCLIGEAFCACGIAKRRKWRIWDCERHNNTIYALPNRMN